MAEVQTSWLLALVAAGCAAQGGMQDTNTTVLRSTPRDPAAFDRMVLFMNLASPAVDQAGATSFASNLVSRLASCGVTTTVVTHDPMDMKTSEQRVDAAATEMSSHVLMIVKAVGGNLGSSANPDGPRTVNVKLGVFDAERNVETWQATGLAEFTPGRGERDGVMFAREVATRLRDDGILTGCQATEVYPGCREDLKRAIAARGRERDASDRRIAAQLEVPLPRCEPRQAKP